MDRSTNTAENEEESKVYPLQFIHRDGLRDIPVPLARITTCGMLQVEVLKEVVSVNPPLGRYVVLSMQTLRGRGAVPSLMLLKLLASSPHRFATKDTLTTQMQQEMEKGTAIRLDTYASYLRGSLCQLDASPALIDPLRLLAVEYLRNGRGSGPGYRLGPYPLLWLDTEALTYQVEHGILMENMGEPALALPFWQRAYQLASRGEYLPDEPHSDWAQSTREQVASYLKQSVHALRRLLLAERGEVAKEEVILLLRSYWLAYKTDEDALRPLMELLGEQERFGEAQEYYQQCVVALEQSEVGRKPAKQTNDLYEFQRIKQLRREPSRSSHKGEHIVLEKGRTLSALHFPSSLLEAFSRPGNSLGAQGKIEEMLFMPEHAMIYIGHEARAGINIAQFITEVDDWIGHAASCQELQLILAQKIRIAHGQSEQRNEETNRSLEQATLLTALATLPLALITSLQQNRRPEIQVEALLPRCAASLTACWFLISSSDLRIVKQNLLVYLPTLEVLAQHYSKYQPVAASLAAQGCMLQAILTLHQLALAEREYSCRKAINYSNTSGDSRLQAAAWMYLGYTHCYQGKPEEAIYTFLQALRCLGELQSLLRSDIYMGLAYAYGQCKEEKKACDALTLAQRYFPMYPEHDPSYLYASCGLSALYIWEGRTYLALGEHYPGRGYYQKAWASLEQITGTRPASERDRTEIIIYQSKAALGQRDLATAACCLGTGLDAAVALGSKRRVSEACETYLHMCRDWPNEPRTQALMEQFRPYLSARSD
jgi:tetratricopeptide (TPR) repeat protein